MEYVSATEMHLTHLEQVLYNDFNRHLDDGFGIGEALRRCLVTYGLLRTVRPDLLQPEVSFLLWLTGDVDQVAQHFCSHGVSMRDDCAACDYDCCGY